MLLGTFVAGAIVVRQAINNTALQARQSVLPVVTASLDFEALAEIDGDFPDLKSVTEDIAMQIGELSYVNYFEFSLFIDPRTRLDVHLPEIDVEHLDTANMDGNLYGEYNFFWMNGISQPEVIHIEEGLFELVEGRVFTEDEMSAPINQAKPTPILIPRVIAQLNNLSVGTVFNLYYEHFVLPEDAIIPDEGFIVDPDELWHHPYNNWVNVSYQFKVIGLLDIDYHIASHTENFHMQLVVFNTVFAPNWKLDEMIRAQYEAHIQWRNIFNIDGGRSLEELLTPTVFWVLEETAYLKAFTALATPFLPDFYKIDAWTHVFAPLYGAMDNMQWIANLILLLGVSATLIILSLLTLLYVRDRRHEMGVYLALGEKKTKIVLQILFEVVPVTLIGMTIAVLIGNIVATEISQGMLHQALLEEGVWITGSTFVGEWQEFSNLEFMGMGREITTDELMALFEIAFDGQVVVIFYLIGILTVMLSTIAPIVYVLKLNVNTNLCLKIE